MLHRVHWLDVWDNGLGQVLIETRESGVVKYLGVSVYLPEEARRALEHPDIEVVQVPCNAWDQGMKMAGVFELAKSLDKLCFVRSVYLQGLLVLASDKVKAKLPHAMDAARRWSELATEFGLQPAQLSVRFALSLNMPLVIGAENSEQVEDNIRLCQEPALPFDMVEKIRNEMSPLLKENITDPRLWKK